jgi:hypothetical protein
MQHLVDHPVAGADPLRVRGIEEDAACNSYVQRRRREEGGQYYEEGERRLLVRPPESE